MLNVQKLNDGYTLVHNDSLCEYIRPGVVEEKYKAKYLGEFCLRGSGGFNNAPMQLYYAEEAHPEGSNYFALYFAFKGDLVITNGISAVNDSEGKPIKYLGVVNEDKEILYSAFRHDYQTYGDLMCDGGREYLKSSLHSSVTFVIQGDKIIVQEPNKELTIP